MGGGGGWGGAGAGVRKGKKEKKEVGKKRKGDWREKEGNACYKNPVLFLSADAGVRKFLLVNRTIEQACSANQTGDFN